MALRIKETEYCAIDAHSPLGRRKTPLGNGARITRTIHCRWK